MRASSLFKQNCRRTPHISNALQSTSHQSQLWTSLPKGTLPIGALEICRHAVSTCWSKPIGLWLGNARSSLRPIEGLSGQLPDPNEVLSPVTCSCKSRISNVGTCVSNDAIKCNFDAENFAQCVTVTHTFSSMPAIYKELLIYILMRTITD